MTAISIGTNTIQLTGKDLSQRITQHIQELAEATDAARMSEEMVLYLETCARFHQYSISNIWCILMACPTATRVAGFQTWKSLGRYVRKGEKGIPILAPIITKTIDHDRVEKELVVGFRVVYVFDIQQTEGEDLPKLPEWKSLEQNQVLFNRLVEFAHTKSIKVVVKPLGHEIQGVSLGGEIWIDPNAGTKSIVHELAHELLHRDAIRPDSDSIRELEAESVGFIVCRHFGLEGLSSPNYIALHGANSALIMASLERIRKTATELIQAVKAI